MVDHSQVRHSLGISFFQCITVQYLFRLVASLHLTVDGNVLCFCLKSLQLQKSQECQASLVCNFDCFVLETSLSSIFRLLENKKPKRN